MLATVLRVRKLVRLSVPPLTYIFFLTPSLAWLLQ